jgi:hypothetical protein
MAEEDNWPGQFASMIGRIDEPTGIGICPLPSATVVAMAMMR